MSKEKRKQKAVSINGYKSKQEFNIGILIFAIIFIYIIVTVFLYATRNRIIPFEVRQGRILDDHSYIGIIIREETVIYAERTGYIYYFQTPLSKLRSGSNVFAITPERLNLSDMLVPEDGANFDGIANDTHSPFVYQVQSFNENFSLERFATVNALRNGLQHSFHGVTNQMEIAQKDAVLNESRGRAEVFSAPRDGILSFRVDGMESITQNEIDAATFLQHDGDVRFLTDKRAVQAGEPVYTLVTGEDWYVVIQVDVEMANTLREMDWIRVRFERDGVQMWAAPRVFVRGNEHFVALSFHHSMIRYAEDRFLVLELILEDQSGLKIPRSAVTEKDFFVVPPEFITTQEQSITNGVYIQNSDGSQTFQALRLYNRISDEQIFLNPNEIESGTTLMIPTTGETFTLGEIRTLQGVFNINQGYAIFRLVNILSENDEFYLIEEGGSFGIFNFDFIAQNGDSVDDGEVVIR
ncbi:MAG: hypothetical protein FWE25_02065 [Lachnospiraceae bacterium]|nr:hypothetical protein [Lachnospiraceae bacterium]